jgi:hypothetical protein
VDDVHQQLRHSEVGAYMAAQATAYKLLPPDIGVIEDWPTLAALHPSDYYGFQPGSVSRDTCETVHLRALREGRAGAVIIDEDDLRKRYPRLAAYLDTHADRVGESTQLLGKSLYLLRPTP